MSSKYFTKIIWPGQTLFEFELNSLRSFDTYDVGRLLWPSDLKDDEGRGFEYRCRQGFFLKKSELERSSSCGICTLYKCELYIVSTVSSVYVAQWQMDLEFE